ncbi:Flp family type IVb pilin [Cryobacterium frigoriphilum]|uniref:Flp family type IVb pilin n=1 Tax=Cryobacterium frigoriphilum TaxID=1259150 RepID=A0A4R9AAC9_9MICO|nr:Flp family type IVb pilin [Cryobacterium frigoriphilum]TFD55173.1 Flp family type IVb pilin [Cryobacterium frigoriphilum]
MKFYAHVHAYLNSLRRDEEGATAVEYGLMVSLIAVVVITAVALIGTNLDKIFDLVGLKLALPTT